MLGGVRDCSVEACRRCNASCAHRTATIRKLSPGGTGAEGSGVVAAVSGTLNVPLDY